MNKTGTESSYFETREIKTFDNRHNLPELGNIS